jgi:hypothetical protein
MRKASRQALQKRHHRPDLEADLMIWATARQLAEKKKKVD